jgi:hypothetical protein
MTIDDLLTQRLSNQLIAAPEGSPADVVSRLGAVQAQDYPGTLWAIALRSKTASKRDVEQAIADREIVRTWPMRGTLHFVAAKDIRWMLGLMAPEVIARAASRYRQLELDDATFQRSRELLSGALQGKQLGRKAAYAVLEENGISAAGQRGIHILCRLCMEGLLCFGSHLGKEPSFALLEEWIPAAPGKSRDEALKEIVLRYFSGHGPASVRDFTWWTGLTLAEAKIGLELNAEVLVHEELDGTTYWRHAESKPTAHSDTLHLLPGFDEYMLGYTDRSHILDLEHSQKVVPGGNGMFISTIVIRGKVEGLWKRVPSGKKTNLIPLPFLELSERQQQEFKAQAGRYQLFLDS